MSIDIVRACIHTELRVADSVGARTRAGYSRVVSGSAREGFRAGDCDSLAQARRAESVQICPTNRCLSDRDFAQFASNRVPDSCGVPIVVPVLRPDLISLWISHSAGLAPRDLLREARQRRCAARIRVTLREARAQLPCEGRGLRQGGSDDDVKQGSDRLAGRTEDFVDGANGQQPDPRRSAAAIWTGVEVSGDVRTVGCQPSHG